MDQDKINQFRANQEQQAKDQAQSDEAKRNAEIVAGAVGKNNQSTQSVKQSVDDGTAKITSEVNKSSQAIISNLPNGDNVTEALNNLVVATVMSRDPKLVEVAQNFTKLLDNLAQAGEKLGKSPLNELPTVNKQLTKALNDFGSKVSDKKEVDYSKAFDNLQSAVENLDIKPVVNVPKTDVSVDLKPLKDLLKEIKQAISENKIDIPKVDLTKVVTGLNKVQETIAGLSFPSSNYVLPFKDDVGKATQLKLTSDGKVPISGTITAAADGAIVDGVDSNIKATVFDYTNSNPLGVVLRDTSGDYVSVGGGTQYTEDAAAAANPVGTAVNLIRSDTPGALVTTDGDNVAQRGTNYGAAYTQIVTSAGAFVDSFGGGTQYTEDAAAAANPVGNALIVVREDARAGSLTTTDGDNVALRGNNSGELYVKHTDNITVNAHAVTNAGTFAVQVDGNALTSLQLIDDTIAVLGTATYTEATTKGSIIGAVRRDANTTLVDTTNEIAPLQVNATGELKVAQIQALPAGANAIGKLAANSGVDIGDVDVTSIIPGVAATNLGKREDDAHTSLDTGVMALAVRSNTAASTSGADGDYQPLITNTTGHLWVDASGQTLTVGSHAVTNAGTFVVQENGAALTSLQLIDDVVYTDDTSTHATGTSKGVGIMATAVPTDTSVNANDIGMVGMTTDRRLYVDASGVAVPVTDNSGSLTVDYATTGSGNATGALRVEIANNGTGLVGLNAGTNAIGKLAANSGVDIGDVDVTTVGTITPGTAASSLGKAEDAGHASGDVGVMTLAVRNDALAAFAGTDLDYSPIAVESTGRQIYGLAPAAAMARGTATTTGTSSTSLIAASGNAGLKTYVTSVQISNSGSSFADITFQDGNGGTTIGYGVAPASGGSIINFPIPLVTTANTALYFAASASSTTIKISAQGYLAP